jgi:Polyketide cyclase / dehydrase and lipid transport
MTGSIVDNVPLFELRAQIPISATPEKVYSVVSDLRRSAEWSPECRGGEWIAGEPATVGAIFRGENLRPDDVVAWAPLIRGVWYTECQVVAAEPGRTFRWAMRTHTGRNQESVWGFDMEPTVGGTILVHHFRMGRATEGIHKIVKDLDETDRKRFVVDWTAKLEGDLADTLRRIKEVVETQ